MTLLRGVRDDVDLMTWLEKFMFPLEARFVSPEFVRWGSRLACWEMIASGTTTFADGYFFEEEVARAADDAGLRAVPGEGIFDVPTPDAKSATEGLARAERYLSDWAGHPRITPALAPHAAYTVGPETFRKTMDLAGRYGAPVLTHLSESDGEIAVVRARYGVTPVRHLAAHGLLGPSLVAAHCVRVDDEEIAILGENGVGVVHCPESNMKLASGVAPVAKMLAARLRLGLGTDGRPATTTSTWWARWLGRAPAQGRGSRPDRRPPARAVLRMATIGGARALHMEERIGSLEAGKRADVIVVDCPRPNALPLSTPRPTSCTRRAPTRCRRRRGGRS